jgi:hypothetical protein
MRETISRRDLFRRDLKPLRAAVSCAIAKADPINLLALGAPGDEYDSEVAAILPRLASAHDLDDVRSIVRDVFVQFFGGETAGGAERYEEAAVAIWDALKRSRRATWPSGS